MEVTELLEEEGRSKGSSSGGGGGGCNLVGNVGGSGEGDECGDGESVVSGGSGDGDLAMASHCRL